MKIGWYKFYNHPYLKIWLGFLWGNFGLISMFSLVALYLAKLRYKFFITGDVQSLTYQRKLEQKILEASINGLSEQVFKDEPTRVMLADYLLKLVKEDVYTQKLMTDLFILMLKGKDFTKDTRGLTEWAISNWLRSEYGRKETSKLIIEQVLKDEKYILPALHMLLINYLESDFKLVSKILEESLIKVAYQDFAVKGLNDSAKKAVKEALVDDYTLQSVIANAKVTMEASEGADEPYPGAKEKYERLKEISKQRKNENFHF